MDQNIHDAVTAYLSAEEESWFKPREIIEALYPKFKNSYSRDTFKRLVFRELSNNPKIMKNLGGPYYAVKRRVRITKHEKQQIKRLFEMVENPYGFFNHDLPENLQYPKIPLERTGLFGTVQDILSKLYKDPREEEIWDTSPGK